MKRAFTLVELLVVVVVLVTLMSLIFRLSGIGEESTRRNVTVMRMQKIENCISGYYAAFGSYPPVKIHGSRNIYYKLNMYGIQQTENGEKDEDHLVWEHVEAACRSQPVGMNFPFLQAYDAYIEATSDALMEMYRKGYTKNEKFKNRTSNLNPGWITNQDEGSWEKCQVFRFGLMSYLLPRYVVMMGNSNKEFYRSFRQWSDNNELPCRMEDGAPYDSWDALNDEIVPQNNGERNWSLWKVEALPSQAVTARWLPNLEGILNCERDLTIYGITVSGDNVIKNFTVENPDPTIYSGGDSQSGEGSGDGSTQYVLDSVTCRDGWEREFYYCSDPPYQSYRFWSAGPNGKTFPPWISEEEIDNDSVLKGRRVEIQVWRSDDIVHMSN